MGLLPTSFMHLLASLEENTQRDGTAITTDRIITWAQSIVRAALGMFGADRGYRLLIQGMLGFRIFWEELVISHYITASLHFILK